MQSFFFHDETCESDWCRYEWQVAADNDIPVLCVVDTSNFKKQDLLAQVSNLSPHLLEYQWLEFSDEYRHAIQERTWTWLDQRIEAQTVGNPSLHLATSHLPGQV